VHEARHVLELGLTELAVERATQEDIDALNATLEKAQKLVERDDPPGKELLDVGVEFHLAVAATAHSPLLASLYGLILEPLVSIVKEPHKRRGNPHDDLAYHRAVVEAIERKDVTTAVKAMSEHIVKTTAIVLDD
jgi:GntR family transcriptional repressor for pyruvate dehydrogenase complex